MMIIQAVERPDPAVREGAAPFVLNLSLRTRTLNEMRIAIALLAESLPQIAACVGSEEFQESLS
jgi:hypothetical protein